MAQMKGWRPCKSPVDTWLAKPVNAPLGPTCGKMVDLGPQKTFKWAGFEPSDQELRDYARSRKESKKKLARRSHESARLYISPPASVKSTPSKDILELSDSEDDLPSLEGLRPSPKRQKKSVRIGLTLSD